MLALMMFAAFNIFWCALVLQLSAPLYNFPHTIIGDFGLAGVARGTSAGLVSTVAHGISLWALVFGIVLLDLGGQVLHVTSQSLIFRTRPEANSRLVGLCMLFYATGSGICAIGTTVTYAHAGWQGVCLLGAAVSLLALLFWAMTCNAWRRLTSSAEGKVFIVDGLQAQFPAAVIRKVGGLHATP